MFPLRRFLALFALLFNLAPAVADDVVKVGVLAFRPKLQTQEQWQPLAAALQARMPERRFEIQVFTYPELNAAVAARQLDFVLTNPGHYVLLSRKFSLSSPIATLLNSAPGGTSLATFGGVIITRADSPVQTLADVRGRRIAAVDSESLGGYQIQAYELKESGLPLPSREQMVLTGAPHDKVIVGGCSTVAPKSASCVPACSRSRSPRRQAGRQAAADRPIRSACRRFRLPCRPVFTRNGRSPRCNHVDAELSGHVAAALLTLGDTPAVLQAI